MALKLIGGALIVGGGGLLGLYIASLFDYRLWELNQMTRCLGIFEGNATRLGMELADALENSAERGEGAFAEIIYNASRKMKNDGGGEFLSFWEEADVRGGLSQEDVDAALEFGRSLGFADTDGIKTAAARLRAYAEAACTGLREKKAAEARLYKSVCMLAGLMVWIVLL